MRRPLILAACLAATHAASVTTASAQLLDQVVAFVDDEPIFLSEVRERARRFHVEHLDAARREQGLRDAVDALIDERLIERYAKDRQLQVAEDEVPRAIATVVAQNGFTDEAAFWSAVNAQGMTRADYEAEVRAQLLKFRVLADSARPVLVTDEEVRRAWEQRMRDAPPRPAYRVSCVAIPVAENAAATERAVVRRRAQELESKIRSGELTFEQAIRSEGGEGAFWVPATDLAPHVLEAVRTIRPGQHSAVLESPAGFQIVKLHDRREDRPSFEAAEEELRHELQDARVEEERRDAMERLRNGALVVRRLREE